MLTIRGYGLDEPVIVYPLLIIILKSQPHIQLFLIAIGYIYKKKRVTYYHLSRYRSPSHLSTGRKAK